MARSVARLIRGETLSVPYYAHAGMQEWVRATVEKNGIEHVLVFSSAMAQFVEDPNLHFERKVIDFVDVDSDYVGVFVMYVTKRSNEFVMGEQCPIRDN